MELSVLGPLECAVDGVRLDLGGPRQQAVLAVLLAARGTHVTVSRLLEEIWGDDDDGASRGALAAHVSRLRAVLGGPEGGGARQALRFGADGYVLSLGADAVDAERFRRLAAAGGECARQQRLEQACELWSTALGLWRGTPYDGISTMTSDVERRRLEDLRAATEEDCAQARLDLGDSARAAEELRDVVARDPFRERAVRLLALGLAGSGRQAEALALVAEVRERLLEEFGLDPGPVLVQLEEELRATGAVAGAAVPAQRQEVPLRPLPVALNALLGRGALLAAARDRLREHRLVTLVGVGGSGKTRLALEVAAREAADRAPAWVSLAGLDDAALVGPAVADALGVVTQPGRSAVDGAVEAIGAHDVLVVLDNCEHLRLAVVDVLEPLLAGCPRVRLLATSREPLGVPGERLVDVPPLPVVDAGGADGAAVELFLQHARRVSPGWSPDEQELQHVRRICRELDGLPLALELAAARSRVLSPAEIADALDDRFALLRQPSGSVVTHHRSLQAALGWSYDLLGEADRTQLRALACFDDGFELSAARAVLGADAPRSVAELSAKSLLVVDRTAVPWRYGMLESMRELARSLSSEDERRLVERRHLLWVEGLVTDAAPELRGAAAGSWLPRLERERANVRAAVRRALDRGDVEVGLRLTADLVWFWYRKGHATEGVRLLSAALASSRPDHPSRGRALVGLSVLRYLQGDPAGALAAAVDAVEQTTGSDELAVLAEAEATRGWMLALHGDLAGAREHAQLGHDLAARAGDKGVQAEALMVLGQLARFDREPPEAQRLLRSSMELAEEGGHQWIVESSTWIAAKVALAGGDAGRALALACQLCARTGEVGDDPAMLAGALVVAAAAAALGRPATAAAVHAPGAALAAQIGFDVTAMDPLDSPWLLGLLEPALADLPEQAVAATRQEVLEQVRRAAELVPLDVPVG